MTFLGEFLKKFFLIKKHRPFFPVRRCLSCLLYPIFPVPISAYVSLSVLYAPAYPLISLYGSAYQAPVPFSELVRPACVTTLQHVLK